MSKKLILFDFDGTVTDNSEGIYNCISYALQKAGKPQLNKEIMRTFIGPSLFDSFMKYSADSEEEANRLVSYYRERYAPVGSSEALIFDGIPELLEKLRTDGYKTAVCSSKPRDFVIKIAKEKNIFNLFDGFFCPDFSSHISDKSGLALSAVKHFGVKKEETVLIGDTKYDVEAAKSADIDCIAVLYGFSSDGELDNADFIAREVKDIYPLIVSDKN